jgi:hypothetical protein
MEPGKRSVESIDDGSEVRSGMTTKKRAKKEIESNRQRPLQGNIECAWMYVSQSFYVKDMETMNDLLDDLEISSATGFVGWYSGPEVRALANTLKEAHKNKFLSIFCEKDVAGLRAALGTRPDDPFKPETQIEDFVKARIELSRIIRGFDDKEYCFFARSSGKRVYIDENPGYIESQVRNGEPISLGRLFQGKYSTFVTGFRCAGIEPVVRQVFTPAYESDASSVEY